MTRGRRSMPWALVGLVALSTLALVLVVLALRGKEPPPPTIVLPAEGQSATPYVVDEPSDEESPSAEPTPTPQTTQPSEASDNLAPRERPLSVLAANTAIRATLRTCPGGAARVQVTTDGGQTWRAAANPSQSVLRLSWVALDNAFVVAAAQPGCEAGFWRTASSGEFWDGPVPPADVWHLLPSSEATELHAPGGVVASPCGEAGTYELEPQSFGSTFVMCRDGRVFRTDDEAQTWTRSGQEPAAVAMGLLEQRPVLAVDGRSDCAGIAVERPDGTRIGCIQGADARGAVALNFAGDSSGMFLSGARAWVTNDGGATWTGAG